MDLVQCFGVYMAIISLKEPQRIPDLIGYQSLIIQSSLHCQEGCWTVYDGCYHLKALAVVITECSRIDITRWKMEYPSVGILTQLPKALLYKPSP